MTCWIYIQTEPRLYTVGFYDPDGKFKSDSDHNDREKAAKRCSFLNGNVEFDNSNTCLIATAPEMLNLLILLGRASNLGKDNPQILEHIEKVIAKAEGRKS